VLSCAIPSIAKNGLGRKARVGVEARGLENRVVRVCRPQTDSAALIIGWRDDVHIVFKFFGAVSITTKPFTD